VELLDAGHGETARAAPGGPEVEEDDLALEGGEGDILAVGVLEGEVGSGSADGEAAGGCLCLAGAWGDGGGRLAGFVAADDVAVGGASVKGTAATAAFVLRSASVMTRGASAVVRSIRRGSPSDLAKAMRRVTPAGPRREITSQGSPTTVSIPACVASGASAKGVAAKSSHATGAAGEFFAAKAARASSSRTVSSMRALSASRRARAVTPS